MLAPSAELASERLVADGSSPLPDGLTPHSLRRTFASVPYALGEDPPTVMAEMGHRTPALALAIYAQAMRRDDEEKARLRAWSRASSWQTVAVVARNRPIRLPSGSTT